MSLNYYDSNFQSVSISKQFRNDLAKTIRVVEESKSQNEFHINVGKLVGMVHFLATMTFQDEIPSDPFLGAVPSTAANVPVAAVAERRPF